VPVYGVENYLQKCINSLVTQSLKNIEIILVDDGSKDSSGQICDQNAKLYPEIIKVIHQVNTGQGGARNNGIKAAHGQYIMFVDGDDYLHTDTIKIAYTAISQNGVDMVVFGINHVNKEGHLIKEEYDGTDFDEVLHTVLDQSLILNSPSPCNKIYRTSLFKKHNIWFPSHVWYEDIRTIMKVYAVIDSIIYIHQTLYNYVQHKESTMHNTHIERNKEILDAFDDIIGYYKANGLFEKYYDELELLTILNVYTAASTRVATVNPNSDLLPLFHSYLSDYFPKYNQNRYIPSLSRQRKILFFLLEKKQYKIVKLLNLLDSRWRTGK
jgi:glycosyltransferase involved in cell wall biosynthesis